MEKTSPCLRLLMLLLAALCRTMTLVLRQRLRTLMNNLIGFVVRYFFHVPIIFTINQHCSVYMFFSASREAWPSTLFYKWFFLTWSPPFEAQTIIGDYPLHYTDVHGFARISTLGTY